MPSGVPAQIGVYTVSRPFESGSVGAVSVVVLVVVIGSTTRLTLFWLALVVLRAEVAVRLTEPVVLAADTAIDTTTLTGALDEAGTTTLAGAETMLRPGVHEAMSE